MMDEEKAPPIGFSDLAFPDVSGKWAMEIYWVRGDENGRVDAEAFIRQDRDGIGMTVRSGGSDSHTLLVQSRRDVSGDPILYYMYEVEPRATHSDAAGPYKGAAILRYYQHGEELSGNYWTSQRTSGRFKLIRKPDAIEATMDDTTDVLLITAIKEEYDAAKATLSANELDGDGVRNWTALEAATNLPHDRGVFYHEGQALFSISIARPSRMGGIETGQFAGRLADRLQPNCLVMCGVCAGNPKDLALGDIVVSELAYQYDEGKREVSGFTGDHRQSLVSEGWRRAAELLRPEALPSFGRPSSRDARYWLLERVHAGGNPKEHPARTRYFAKGEWAAMIDTLQAEKIIELDGTSLKLTPGGVAEVEHSLIRDVDPPEQLPFAIKVGPIASGNVVVKDGITWESLKDMGVRSVIGLEMEAAAIGRAAGASGVPEWIVVKGVMDYADPQKDDRYKPFAARASSEVLRAFLVGRFIAGPVGKFCQPSVPPSSLAGSMSSGNSVLVSSTASAMPNRWRPNTIAGAFFDELRDSIERNAPSFSGTYELAVEVARQAQEQASLAFDKSDAVRAAIGDHISRTHRGKISKKPVVLPVPAKEGIRPLIAKIWNTHDEYLGEATGSEPDGLGVQRAYEFSEELTPSLLATYAGCMEAGKYGPLGVFTFFDQSHFAGRWASGHPNFGYREYIGTRTELDCDFYLGAMRGVANHLQPFWHPHGKGIAVDAGTRRVRCGVLDNGEFHQVHFEFAI
ncbi:MULTISPECIES: hypothetical protein [unclassified Rhizobium]|uniref:Cap15 family cyclic dinucleotide receptor domain-containing protein n=1 Tax=unclassified Rhizobium TaxID=2613769 RepID=UPI003816D9EF